MKLVILAGGKGTRLGARWSGRPKPMVPIAGKPILEHQLDLARRYGFNDVLLLLGHMGEKVAGHFGERWNGMRLSYLQEETPLGTAGAVKSAAGLLDGDFLVFYGDTIMDVDLAAMVDFHRAAGAAATLLVHPNDHPYDSDLLDEREGRVIAFHSKPHPEDLCARNLVNAALYILSPTILPHVEEGVSSDFGKDIFPRLLRRGLPLAAYNTAEYIKDVGTLDRLERVERDILSGKVARLNRRNPRSCIFLDRDGTINREIDTVRRAEELEFLPGVPEAIRRINKSEFLAVVATNQPAIAKGFMSEDDLAGVHARVEMELGRTHAYLDRIYFCPHHPEKGFAGERPELKIACQCRKPGIGMIEQARRELNIDLSPSWLIGDRTVDVMTARNAGLRSVLLRTGFAGADAKYDVTPDLECESLEEAVRRILS